MTVQEMVQKRHEELLRQRRDANTDVEIAEGNLSAKQDAVRIVDSAIEKLKAEAANLGIEIREPAAPVAVPGSAGMGGK